MKEQVLKLFNDGLSYREIAKIVGCSKSTVSVYCNPRSDLKAKIRHKYKKNKLPKLTEEELEILAEIKLGNKNPLNFCECGHRKSKKVKFCKHCRYKNKTLADYKLNRVHPCYAHNRVRSDARATMLRNKVIKQCKFCKTNEFKEVLEVAHIKAITTFSDDSKIIDINSLDNLVYLCPSHHRLLDKNLIKL